MWTDILFIAFGGSIGAICRHEVGRRISARWPGAFPFGTLVINLVGAFLLGVLIGAKVPPSMYLLLGTGFMGAFTTFSTFIVEISDRLQRKQTGVALLYVLVSLIGGTALAYTGMRFIS